MSNKGFKIHSVGKESRKKISKEVNGQRGRKKDRRHFHRSKIDKGTENITDSSSLMEGAGD